MREKERENKNINECTAVCKCKCLVKMGKILENIDTAMRLANSIGINIRILSANL